MDFKVQYEQAEQENDNLRAALKVALAACPPEVVAQVGAMIAGPVEDGGVVEDGREEDEARAWELGRAGELLEQIVEALHPDKDGLFRIAEGLPKDWPAQATRIAEGVKEHAPGKPIMLTAREIAERAAKSSPIRTGYLPNRAKA